MSNQELRSLRSDLMKHIGMRYSEDEIECIAMAMTNKISKDVTELDMAYAILELDKIYRGEYYNE